jgi:hypothetical protein
MNASKSFINIMDGRSLELLELTDNSISNPKRDTTPRRIQVLMLIMSSLVCIGSYFVFDMPSAIQLQLMDVSSI